MAKKKEKGLDALLSEEQAATPSRVPQIELIPLAFIRPSPLNPRKTFDEESLAELTSSICQNGLLQPITVRLPYQDNLSPIYEIVCGERRWRACKAAELEDIACIVREMTDDEALDAMITENLQRQDVEPLEEARAFNLLEQRGVERAELAARFGKSESYIYGRLRLNELAPVFTEMLEKKELKLSHAVELCRMDKKEQEDIHASNYAGESGRWKDYGTKDLRIALKSRSRKLENAIFSTSECNGCQFNTSNSDLFGSDDTVKNYCTRNWCFEKKTIEFRAARAIHESSIEGCPVVFYGSPDDFLGQILQLVRDKGAEVYEGEMLYLEQILVEDSAQGQEQLAALEAGELKKAFVLSRWNDDDKFHYIRIKQATAKNDDRLAQYAAQNKEQRRKRLLCENFVKLLKEREYYKREKTLNITEMKLLQGLLICDTDAADDFGVENIEEAIEKVQLMEFSAIQRRWMLNCIDEYDSARELILLEKLVNAVYPDDVERIHLEVDTELVKKDDGDETD